MATACPRCHSGNSDSSKFCSTCAEPLTGPGRDTPSPTVTMRTPAQGLRPGDLVAGKYKIIDEIGRGGMGVVYKAEDIKLQRTVALKFLPAQWTADAEARERFIQEARAASSLDHPNICTIFEIGETEDGRMFIAMACYEGESLRERIKRGPLEAKDALAIAVQIAQGMAKAHQKRIVHRDLKPANILITPDGTAKIVDFGLAKLAGQANLTREGTTIGTVAYMSPEQARGEAVDGRTDIWSLGVVLYEMLAGVLPFAGEADRTLINAILHREPQPLTKSKKELPAGLENIVFKALRKNPSVRYQKMDELLADLQAVAEGLKPLKAGSGIFRGRILGVKKTYAYPALVGTVVLAVLAILFVFPKRGRAYDSIAVLPFVNQSGNPGDTYFADGMHAALIRELSRITGIKTVISQNSVMGYRGSTKRSSEIAAELGVGAVVSAAALVIGDRVAISFEISDGQTDRYIGGDRLEREYRDILALQGEAALAIARKIKSSLSPEEAVTLGERRKVNPEAYDEYLKGKQLLDQFIAGVGIDQSAVLDKSLAFFDRALDIDPQSAEAHSGRAVAYFRYGMMFGPADVYLPKAKDEAWQARRLDESLLDPLLVLGDLLFFGGDAAGGEREYQRLIRLFPASAAAHASFASNMECRNRDLAIFHAGRAGELDPLNYNLATVIAGVYWGVRAFDQSAIMAKKMTALYPNNPDAHNLLSGMLFWTGQVEEGWREYRKSIELGGPDNPLQRAWMYAKGGEPVRARETINEVLKKTKEMDSFIAVSLASAFALLGDKDESFRYLDWVYVKNRASLAGIECYAQYDKLRSDPRWPLLLEKARSGKSAKTDSGE